MSDEQKQENVPPVNEPKAEDKQPDAKPPEPKNEIEEVKNMVNQLAQTMNSFMSQNKHSAPSAPPVQPQQYVDYDDKQAKLDFEYDNGRLTPSQYTKESRRIEAEKDEAIRQSMDSRFQQERNAALDWVVSMEGFDEKVLEDPEVQQEARRIATQYPMGRKPYADAVIIISAINNINQRRFAQKQGNENLKGALDQSRADEIRKAQSVPSGAPVPNGQGGTSFSPEEMDAMRRLGRDPNKVAQTLNKYEGKK